MHWFHNVENIYSSKLVLDIFVTTV